MSTPGYLMPEKTEQACAEGPHCIWLVSVYEALKDARETNDLFQKRQYNEAKQGMLKQLELYRRTVGSDYAYSAGAYGEIGWITRQQGRLEESAVYYEKALAIMEKAHGPNHIDVAMALDWLADVYNQDHRYAEAEPLYQRALRIHESYVGASHELYQMFVDSVFHLYFNPSPYGQATAVANDVDSLAGVYHDEHREAEAEPLYKRALAAHETILNGWFLKYWGTTSYPMSNLHAAEESYSRTLGSLAYLYEREHRYAEAEEFYRKAIVAEQEARGPKGALMPGHMGRLAIVLEAEGRYSEAEDFYRRSMADHDEVPTTLNMLANVLQKDHKLAEARPIYERARQTVLPNRRISSEVSDEAFSVEQRDEEDTLPNYTALLADIARNPASDPKELAPDQDAFIAVEQARSGEAQAALAQAGARNVASDPATSDLARHVQALRDRHKELEKSLHDEYAKPAAQRNAEITRNAPQAMLDLDRETDEATGHLLASFPKYAELTAPTPIDYAGVKQMLAYDEALVSYYALGDRVLIWLVRSDRAVVYRDCPIKKESLKAMVARMRASLKRDQPFDVVDAHDLYHLLLEPLNKSLDGVKHLIVVPDDTLLPLPFATLISSNEGEAYKTLADDYRQGFAPSLIELEHDYPRLSWLADADFAISTLPSATSFRALRNEERRPASKASTLVAQTEPFIGVGDPLLDGTGGTRGGAMVATRGADSVEDIRKLPRLPGAHDELIAEATALGADPQTALFTEERATKSTVMSLNDGRLGQARVIAFATHALIGGELEGLKEPALVLTPPKHPGIEDNGLLTIDDILRLKLQHNEWVVLSACNTAAADGSGEGLSGLARAFFYAGAPSLLVSQWSVDDKATQRLMTDVLRAYASNPQTSRAYALRTGMRKLMTEEARGEYSYFAHPYAWAPFFIVGEGGPAAK
jgi:CHAT domain-containing protein